ncbi:hypothetical protein PIB30_001014 [Stylosanthes scabra]|uniref:Uncharacterized protein n=1 Tax=Stylosanthes scabra TaxID=79078 RepID=A0ABU6T2C2_9FABA|nr:hypothetical protein [Stylosanthes scabra]
MTTSSKPTSSKSKKNTPDSTVSKKASLAIIYNKHDTIIEDPDDRPLLPKDQEKAIKTFYPSVEGRELLIAKDIYTHNFLKGKSFRNDPKTTFRGVDLFKAWYDRVAPSYIDI